MCAEAVIASVDASRRKAAALRVTEAVAEPDGSSRLAALDAVIEAELTELPAAKRVRIASDLGLARNRYRQRCDALRAASAHRPHAEGQVSSARREIALAAIDGYVKVMQRTALLCERVVTAFARVDRQLAKLGREALPDRAASG